MINWAAAKITQILAEPDGAHYLILFLVDLTIIGLLLALWWFVGQLHSDDADKKDRLLEFIGRW